MIYNYQTFIGIDPGKTGAIAAISPEGIKLIDCPCTEIRTKVKSPKPKFKTVLESNPELMANELKKLITFNTVVILESVHSMPKQGLSSTFDFGMNFGIWQGIIAALGIPLELVTPQVWKKHFGLIREEKDASRIKAMQLFPEVGKDLKLKKNNGRAEALLMAEYLRRKTIKDRVA